MNDDIKNVSKALSFYISDLTNFPVNIDDIMIYCSSTNYQFYYGIVLNADYTHIYSVFGTIDADNLYCFFYDKTLLNDNISLIKTISKKYSLYDGRLLLTYKQASDFKFKLDDGSIVCNNIFNNYFDRVIPFDGDSLIDDYSYFKCKTLVLKI